MVCTVRSLSFQGIDANPVDVEVQMSSGTVSFNIVGLADKAVAESKERVRAALHSLGLSLPAKRMTVNLAPADLIKEGSHYDLPIALAVLGAMGILPKEEMSDYCVLGELGLDASIRAVNGVLPAAIYAHGEGKTLICPKTCGQEAAWAGKELEILAPDNLLQLLNHVKGTQILSTPEVSYADFKPKAPARDLSEVKGQETAKRALEVAAAGGHNLLMLGPPGSGKSMLASCMPGIMPPLDAREALHVSMIHSLAGTLPEGGLVRERPFRDPHHSASLPALVGGGHKVKPGEISLAHNGVLFLDELPEFSRATLEALRQPLETGRVMIARANSHVTFPANFQLIAAMNPCRCGHLGEPEMECTKAPRCGTDYQAKISGPMLDRIDLRVEVGAVSISDLTQKSKAETSEAVRRRVMQARALQKARFQSLGFDGLYLNAEIQGEQVEQIITLDEGAKDLAQRAATQAKLSARGYYKILKTARTIADLSAIRTGDPQASVQKEHVAEAISYRHHTYN